MSQPTRLIALLTAISLLILAADASAATVDFQDISVPTDPSLSGQLGYAATATPTGGELIDAAGGYSTSGGTQVSPSSSTYFDPNIQETYDVSNFASGGAQFANSYGESYGDWYGWSISSVNSVGVPTRSEYGVQNDDGTGTYNVADYASPYQYSAYTVGTQPLAGGGADGSSNYAVFYNYGTAPAGAITLPAGTTPVSIDITNTTYTALCALYGDSQSLRFDSPLLLRSLDGANPILTLVITGWTGGSDPAEVGSPVSRTLAEYTPLGGVQMINQWTSVNLSGLAGAQQLEFAISTNVDNTSGPSVPFTFAADDLVLATPEPSSLVLTLIAGLCAAAVALRRRMRRISG